MQTCNLSSSAIKGYHNAWQDSSRVDGVHHLEMHHMWYIVLEMVDRLWQKHKFLADCLGENQCLAECLLVIALAQSLGDLADGTEVR